MRRFDLMLDIHAVSSGGSLTTLAKIGTIAVNDTATVAGVPIQQGAKLIAWGGMTTIADVIEQIQLLTQDQVDPQNGENFLAIIGSSLLGLFYKPTNINYKTGARSIWMAQKTGAANNLGFTMDLYPDAVKMPAVKCNRYQENNIVLAQLYGGALTAITWGKQAFTPGTAIPNGKYAILGAWAEGLTNYALLTFLHADFGQYSPGFPVVDFRHSALANATQPIDPLFLNHGYQFVYLSEELNQPVCPVFRVTNAGTGLNLNMLSITGDTPQIVLNLARMGDV